MKDTLKNRLRAIHSLASLGGEPIEWEMKRLDKMSVSELRDLAEQANKLLTNIYNLAHGGLSSCCKGTSADLIEPNIIAYEGDKDMSETMRKVDAQIGRATKRLGES